MPITEEINGNIIKIILDKEYNIMIHGCNCFGVMGAGLARQVSAVFPYAYDVDRGINEEGEMTEPLGNYNRLGTYTMAEIDDNIIINAYTQFEPGANFEYCALIDVLACLNNDFEGKTILFPEIGCGIGGGTWSVVRQIINEHTPNLDVIIVHYQTEKKEKITEEILDKE
jgi:O-acetyl-ADP-ribose deacetylase (regulator of RNase III)